MSEPFELGAGVVLDPDNLTVGSYARLDGKIFIVSAIIDKQVHLRPLTVWEQLQYGLRNGGWCWILIGAVLLSILFFFALR